MSLGAAQGLWRRAPLGLRRLAAPLVGRGLAALVRASGRPAAPPSLSGLPVKLVGAFSSSHGIGASARLARRGFEAVGAAVEAIDLALDGLDFGHRLPAPTPAAAWIFHANPPELIAALAQLGPRRVLGPRFGYWAWELPRAPAAWLRDARLVDEVWAPSRYTAEALAAAAAPARVVPHPLFLEDYEGVAPLPRERAFEAVTVFDFASSAARKNPQGAIAAFARAFGDDPDARLTIKAQGGARHPQALAALAAGLPANVRLVDEVWPYAQVKALIAAADVLISLHRAEGFGLTLAEAMALGTPVVATGFSGALDFIDDGCALTIAYELTAVKDPQGVYRGQQWAEPDVEAAAEALRRLRTEPGLRQRLAEAGRRRVAERLSPRAWFATLPDAVREAAAPTAR
jgi:glycosyltransferase involved in cell wall biosynthesis